MSKLVMGLLVAGAIIAGTYAIASALATSMAPTFATAESARHTGVAGYAKAIKRATTEHRDARDKCRHVSGIDQERCDAMASMEQKRARTEARIAYRDGARVPDDDEKIDVAAGNTRKIDVVLFRAHRQFP